MFNTLNIAVFAPMPSAKRHDRDGGETRVRGEAIAQRSGDPEGNRLLP